MIAAFQVLAALYLPAAKEMFALIAAGAAVACGVLVSWALGDAWQACTGHDPAHTQWLDSQQVAYRAANTAFALVVLVLAAGVAAYFSGVSVDLSAVANRIFVGISVAVAVGAGLGGVFRTMHAVDGRHKGIRRSEAFVVLGSLAMYLAALMVFLP